MSEQDDERTSAKIAARKTGVVNRLKDFPQYLGNARQEMKLVTRPSWEEVRATTLVVVVFTCLLLLYLAAWDWVFDLLYRWLFGG